MDADGAAALLKKQAEKLERDVQAGRWANSMSEAAARAGRRAAARFIGKYGCGAYFRNNKNLLFCERQMLFEAMNMGPAPDSERTGLSGGV